MRFRFICSLPVCFFSDLNGTDGWNEFIKPTMANAGQRQESKAENNCDRNIPGRIPFTTDVIQFTTEIIPLMTGRYPGYPVWVRFRSAVWASRRTKSGYIDKQLKKADKSARSSQKPRMSSWWESPLSRGPFSATSRGCLRWTPKDRSLDTNTWVTYSPLRGVISRQHSTPQQRNIHECGPDPGGAERGLLLERSAWEGPGRARVRCGWDPSSTAPARSRAADPSAERTWRTTVNDLQVIK
jgi:hypothetical protein